MYSKAFLLISFITFFFFVVFSYLVHKNLFTQIDFDTTVKLQDNIGRRFDEAFSLFSDIGNFEPMLLLLIIILILRKKLSGIFVFALFGFLHSVELFGKFFIQHSPPPEFMLRVKHLIEFSQFHVRADFSYPSGHMARAVFLTIILTFFTARSGKLSKTQKILIISLLALYNMSIFISRVYLGEHWISDVVGGLLLGLSLALLAALAI